MAETTQGASAPTDSNHPLQFLLSDYCLKELREWLERFEEKLDDLSEHFYGANVSGYVFGATLTALSEEFNSLRGKVERTLDVAMGANHE